MRPKSFHSTVTQLLTSLIFLRYTVTVAALSELHPRQKCDTADCPDWSWFTTIEDKAQDSWQSISEYLGGYIFKHPPEESPKESPEESIPTNPTESEFPGIGQGIDPQNPWDTDPEPQIELFSTTECPVAAPDADYDSSNPTQLRECSAVPAQIVFPTDCTSPKNALVGQKLAVMDPSFIISRSPRCPGEHGVVFWLAHITPDQVASMLGETDGAVKSIVPDSPVKTPPLTPMPGLKASHNLVPGKSKAGNGLKKKRVVLEKTNDLVYDPSLAFLSIAPGKKYDDSGDTSDPYVYFRTAVQSALQTPIRVYLVDTGYDPKTKQIREEGLEWIYGIGTKKKPGDRKDHHGTCIASKIGGLRFGVFKGGPVFTIVKVSASVGSLLDALGKILFDIRDNKKLSVEGRAVVNINSQWALGEDHTEVILQMIMAINAILDFKIMVVTPATTAVFQEVGNDAWPGKIAEAVDFITVGGVAPIDLNPTTPYGSLVDWALPGATVYAPAVGFCVLSANQVDEEAYNGPPMPAAITTGLIAYFLAIPDLYDYFMAQPNWASAVKQYVVAMSYPRHQLVPSVWNGIDWEDEKETYNVPGDPWIGIPYTGNPRFQ